MWSLFKDLCLRYKPVESQLSATRRLGKPEHTERETESSAAGGLLEIYGQNSNVTRMRMKCVCVWDGGVVELLGSSIYLKLHF